MGCRKGVEQQAGVQHLEADERYLSTEEVAEFLGVSSRMVLALPIKQYRLGPRTVRFRLRDVYGFLERDDPNQSAPAS